MVFQGIKKGIMPSRVIVGFISGESRSGDKNCFNFQHFNITEIALKVSGKYLPYSTPLKIDFENDKYAKAYDSVFRNVRMCGFDILLKNIKTDIHYLLLIYHQINVLIKHFLNIVKDLLI
jgi:hypothetical protein